MTDAPAHGNGITDRIGNDLVTAAPLGARKRRRWRGLAVLLLACATAAVAVLAFERYWANDSDGYRIRAERIWRRTFADFGLTLPGTPDLANLDGRLKAHGVALGNEIFIRVFKREFELELWVLRDGRFEHFATYPMCRWSGTLGPKLVQGDRQAPEGFYLVDAAALNPNSRWHRSFNLGYPNAFDRAKGRTGSLIMVHGGCGSIGCFAMTNAVIDEIWQIVTSALRNGQKRFQVQVFPFRMTQRNLDRYAGAPNAAFWQELKPGYDMFEADRLPPKVSVCEGRYAFEPARISSDGSTAIEQRCPPKGPQS